RRRCHRRRRQRRHPRRRPRLHRGRQPRHAPPCQKGLGGEARHTRMFLFNLLRPRKKTWPDFTRLPNPGERSVFECIGTSGVGKSTVVGEYLRSCVRSSVLPPATMHAHTMPGDLAPGELSPAHAWLWDELIGEPQTEPEANPSQSAHLHHVRYMIRADNLLRRSDNPTPVLLDEGIVHNGSPAIKKVRALPPTMVKAFFRNRRVIHCTTNEEHLHANLQRRKSGAN